MSENTFKCPSCGELAADVVGDVFQDHLDLVNTGALTHLVEAAQISVSCGNGHTWFEAARFSHPLFNNEGQLMEPAKITHRVTGAVQEKKE